MRRLRTILQAATALTAAAIFYGCAQHRDIDWALVLVYWGTTCLQHMLDYLIAVNAEEEARERRRGDA